MALITMPTVYPSSCRFRCNYNIAESESPFALSGQFYDWGVGRWEGEITIKTFGRGDRDNQMALRAFLSAMRGKLNVFNYGDPEYLAYGARGVATGTPLVNGASQTGTSLVTDGWTAGVTGILKAGDYVQLGTGASAQLYQQISDVNSNGSGQATLTLNRPLLSSPSDNAAIVVTGAKGTFRLVENDGGWEGDSTGASAIVIPFKEAL